MKIIYKMSALVLGFAMAFSLPANAQGSAAALGESNLARQGMLIEGLDSMFVKGSAGPLLKRLAPDFSVGAYSHQTAINCLKTIASRYHCDSIRLKAVQEIAGKQQLHLQLYPKGKAPVESFAYANKEFQLMYLDLFDQLYGMNRYQSSKLVAKIPFETEHGSIVLKVKINGSQQVLRLLFDTGADGIALKESLADSIGLKRSSEQNASVVGGQMKISISEGNVLQLGDFEWKDQRIAIFKEMGKDVDGILGNGLAKKYITKVDFDLKELSLYDFGDYTYPQPGVAVPVTVPSGLFIIPGVLGVTAGQSLPGSFVFDSGAAYHLICFRPFVKQHRLLVGGFKSEYHSSTTSMGISTPTFSGKASTFAFSHMPEIKNMPVSLMAGGGQSEDWKPGFDGSIGIRLISRYNFTINLQRKEIYFSPNKSYAFPYDFSIGSYLFGFDLDGSLRVQGLLTEENPAISLKAGMKVSSINGLSAVKLLKDRNLLNKMLELPEGTKYLVETAQEGKSIKDQLVKTY